jgi:hypothetical protein
MARRAGSEHGTDATPEHPTDRSGEALPTDLPNDPAPEAIDPPFEDPALGVDTLSEEGAGAVPLDPSRTDTPEFLRPDEPADALVVGATDPAEEASPVRFWEADAGPADQEASDFRATSPDASNSDGDLAGRTIEDRTDDQPGERDDAAVPPTRTEPFAGHEGIATAERSVLPPPASARRGGLGALLLGGLIAAALGFGAAWLAQDRFGGARLPADLEERLAALEARPVPDGSEVQALDERITGIESRLAALEEAPAPEEPLASPGDAAPAAPPVDLEPLREEVTAGLAQAEERAADLEERVAALETRPAAPAASPEAPSGSLATDPGPALRTNRTPQESDAGSDALAALEPRLAAVETGLAETRDALSETGTALESLDARVSFNEAALSEVDAQAGDTQARLDETATRLGEAESRLDTAETRLDDVEATGTAAVEEARAAAAALAETRSRAEAAESEARREAAIAALDSALDAGEPFEAALPALGTDAPEALARAASAGVASLATLRETFPEAARAGLAAARGAGLLEEGGVTGFLFGQLSVRSTAPREGDDVDAVLSRAEAALARGRLAEALAEVESLPEPVRAAMAGWIAQARARAEAEAALETLRSAEPPAAPAD